MQHVVSHLQTQIHRLEQGRSKHAAQTVSSGFAALDRLLPAGGLRRGTVLEWLAEAPGSGAALLALIAAREACRERGLLVVVDRHQRFCPLPLFALGLAASDIVIVRPSDLCDQAWAIDQALRSPAIGATVGWLDRVDDRTLRRMQLAAEASGAIGCFLRPLAARGDPAWADVRLAVRPLASQRDWRIRVELLRWRGGGQGGATELMLRERIDDQTHPVSVAPQLAHPATPASSLRA